MNETSKYSKIIERLSKLFHKIFEPSHIFYTITFFIVVVVISLLSFIANPIIGNVLLFIASTFSLAFIFLMISGVVPKMKLFLFSPDKKFGRKKILSLIIAFGISVVIIALYFIFTSLPEFPIQFLRWDYILPYFFVGIYFGWNIIQIFFIKAGFEQYSIKADNWILKDKDDFKRNQFLSSIFLILALAVPVLIQIGTYFGFIDYFEANVGDPFDPFLWFNGWNIAMFAVIVITSWRLITIFIKSKRNETPNVFSSIFYILIWIIIWYRSFSFINSFRSVAQVGGIDIFRILMDVLLMIFTAIMVLKGLGTKVTRFRILNENNLAFLLFAFTILYIEGQIVMITGAGALTGSYTDRNQISLLNNFLILVVSICFYWWYSEYTLERKGLILRKAFKPEEVIVVVRDFKQYLINSGALDSGKINEREFQNFLRKKKLNIEEKRVSENNALDNLTNNKTDI
ncbi:MAG: hypothetical protein KGD68_01025 [Candidatus Lokiarchaeota archaeon]|nr:hypothetical protein [Candidatus Lokiarchaeota archaeon]